jgi:hypothetical protein
MAGSAWGESGHPERRGREGYAKDAKEEKEDRENWKRKIDEEMIAVSEKLKNKTTPHQ